MNFGNSSSPEKVPPQEFDAEKLETGFEHLIESSHLIGRGKDAVVFRLSGEDITEEEIRALAENGFIPDAQPESLAAKILKVYQPGLGDREFKMQQEARRILEESQTADVSVCRIPNAFIAEDRHITDKTRVLLNGYGAELKDRAELIVMDYVDGKDLGTIMYDFVLSGTGIDQEFLDDLSYEEKEQQVGNIIGFEVPSGEGSSPEEIESERSLVFARNEQKLITYMRKHGFILDPNIIDALERSIHILHKNKLHHNDIHKRNVMIGRDGTPYLIDFGRSGAHPDENGLEDLAAPRMWHPLTKTFEQDALEKEVLTAKEILRTTERMMQQPQFQDKFMRLKNEIEERGVTALSSELGRARGSDSLLERFFMTLKPLHDDASLSAVVSSFIGTLSSPEMKWRPAEANMVKRFKNSGFWS